MEKNNYNNDSLLPSFLSMPRYEDNAISVRKRTQTIEFGVRDLLNFSFLYDKLSSFLFPNVRYSILVRVCYVAVKGRYTLDQSGGRRSYSNDFTTDVTH